MASSQKSGEPQVGPRRSSKADPGWFASVAHWFDVNCCGGNNLGTRPEPTSGLSDKRKQADKTPRPDVEEGSAKKGEPDEEGRQRVSIAETRESPTKKGERDRASESGWDLVSLFPFVVIFVCVMAAATYTFGMGPACYTRWSAVTPGTEGAKAGAGSGVRQPTKPGAGDPSHSAPPETQESAKPKKPDSSPGETSGHGVRIAGMYVSFGAIAALVASYGLGCVSMKLCNAFVGTSGHTKNVECQCSYAVENSSLPSNVAGDVQGHARDLGHVGGVESADAAVCPVCSALPEGEKTEVLQQLVKHLVAFAEQLSTDVVRADGSAEDIVSDGKQARQTEIAGLRKSLREVDRALRQCENQLSSRESAACAKVQEEGRRALALEIQRRFAEDLERKSSGNVCCSGGGVAGGEHAVASPNIQYGTLRYPDGSEYGGSYVDVGFEGRGAYTSGDDVRAEGHGGTLLKHGWGSLQSADRNVQWEGWFENDKMHGWGTQTDLSGRYEGQWNMGEMSGLGVFTWANGARFEGQWNSGQMDGYGKMTYCDEGIFRQGALNHRLLSSKPAADASKVNGSECEGSLASAAADEGRPVESAVHAQKTVESDGLISRNVSGASAYGELSWPDKSVYKGSLCNGQPHGGGTLEFADGSRFEGRWANGLRQGLGVHACAEPSGESFLAWWSDAKVHGYCLRSSKEGTPLWNGICAKEQVFAGSMHFDEAHFVQVSESGRSTDESSCSETVSTVAMER